MYVTQSGINVTSVILGSFSPPLQKKKKRNRVCNLVKAELHSHIKAKSSVNIALVSYQRFNARTRSMTRIKGAWIFYAGKFTCNIGILLCTPLRSPAVKAAHRAYNFGIFMGLMLPARASPCARYPWRWVFDRSIRPAGVGTRC